MNWIVAYDIAQDRRRDHVSSLLSGIGWRIQFSLFEVELTESELVELVEDLETTIDLDTDRVHLFPQAETGPDRILIGQATLPSEDRFYIV